MISAGYISYTRLFAPCTFPPDLTKNRLVNELCNLLKGSHIMWKKLKTLSHLTGCILNAHCWQLWAWQTPYVLGWTLLLTLTPGCLIPSPQVAESMPTVRHRSSGTCQQPWCVHLPCCACEAGGARSSPLSLQLCHEPPAQTSFRLRTCIFQSQHTALCSWQNVFTH